MSEPVDLQDFIGGFVVEAEELLAMANSCLLEIEAAGGAKPKAVRDLFRALHTIKGLAGMVGVEPIMEIAHVLETLLRTADRSGGSLQRGAIEVSLQGVRAISERVRAVAERRIPAPAPAHLIELISGTDATSQTVSTPLSIAAEWDQRLSTSERQQVALELAKGTPAWTLMFEPSAARTARGISIASVRTRLAELGEIVKVAPRTRLDAQGKQAGIAFDLLVTSTAPPAQLAEAIDAPVESLIPIVGPPPVAAAPALASDQDFDSDDEQASRIGRTTVRVELARLDELQDQLAALIVSRFRLERELAAQAARGIEVRKLREVADLQARQLRDLRRAILRVRMVRVAEVVEPLALLVRSVARANHKDVRLVLDVRDAELDKAVADRLLPALIHLVRNAVDHAIEPPEVRIAQGKPAFGTIRVSCAELASKYLELAISDDGQGIDRAKVARRAGFDVADDPALLDVLTTAGFSTRDAVSQTSGRGVGMDIVKRVAVQELGGELNLTTALGVGTTFTLRVPLTIAIVEVFTFECAHRPFVVPVATIEEIFELGDERIEPPAKQSDSRIRLVSRRGRAMPLISLGEALSIDNGAPAKKAMVIRHDGELIAFAVDRMLGRQEVVVRPVDDPLVRAVGIAGATDLGDGRPTLMLDLGELGAVMQARAV